MLSADRIRKEIPMRALLLLSALHFSLSVLLPVSPASAQDRDAARVAFQAGVAAYGDGRYADALESFQDAYRIAPHPSVRVNMANCYEQLGRPVEAVDHFERFLIEASDADPAQSREIRAAITRLRATIGEIFLRVEPEGATVTIDGTTTLRAPILDAVKLVAGTHHIEVSLAGFGSVERRVELAGGGREEVRITLTAGTTPMPVAGADPVADPPEDGTPPPRDPPPAERDGRRITTPVWIAGGATVALGVTALVVGILALGADSDFEQAVIDSNDPSLSPADRAAARADGLDAEDRASRRALVADILGGAAVAAAAATVVLFFVTGDDDEDRYARARLRPIATHQSAGLSLQGAF